MKKLALLGMIAFLLPLIGCQEKVDLAEEKEAIKTVIVAETNAFWDQDLVKLLETLIQDDNLVYISVGGNGYRERLGWDKNYAYYKKAAAEDWSSWTDIVVDRSNWKIDICRGESAFVMYNQEMSFKLDGESMNTHSKELRMLEKEKGNWKIVMVQWIDLSSFEKEGEAVEKDF